MDGALKGLDFSEHEEYPLTSSGPSKVSLDTASSPWKTISFNLCLRAYNPASGQNVTCPCDTKSTNELEQAATGRMVSVLLLY